MPPPGVDRHWRACIKPDEISRAIGNGCDLAVNERTSLMDAGLARTTTAVGRSIALVEGRS